jgi:hypothetical protein
VRSESNGDSRDRNSDDRNRQAPAKQAAPKSSSNGSLTKRCLRGHADIDDHGKKDEQKGRNWNGKTRKKRPRGDGFIQRTKQARIWEKERTMEAFIDEMVRWLVLTFRYPVTMESAKTRAHRFLKRYLVRIGAVDEHIRVMERHESGQPHVNLLIHMLGDYDRVIRYFINQYGSEYGFGVYYFEPVESAGAVSNYLTDELWESHEGHAFSCSSGVKRFKRPRDMEVWRRGKRRFMEQHGCANFDEMTMKLGPIWPGRYKVEIEILGQPTVPK